MIPRNPWQTDKISNNRVVNALPLPPFAAQWFKAYWDQVTNCQPTGSEYDGPSRRAQCKTGDVKGGMGQPAGPGRTISQGSRAAPASAAVVSAAAPMRKAQPAGGASAAQRPSVTGSESSEQVGAAVRRCGMRGRLCVACVADQTVGGWVGKYSGMLVPEYAHGDGTLNFVLTNKRLVKSVGTWQWGKN